MYILMYIYTYTYIHYTYVCMYTFPYNCFVTVYKGEMQGPHSDSAESTVYGKVVLMLVSIHFAFVALGSCAGIVIEYGSV